MYLKLEKKLHVISCRVIPQLQESMKHDSSPDCGWMIARQSTDLRKTPHEPGLGENRRLVTDEPVEFEK